jgi:hypothetical protein
MLSGALVSFASGDVPGNAYQTELWGIVGFPSHPHLTMLRACGNHRNRYDMHEKLLYDFMPF